MDRRDKRLIGASLLVLLGTVGCSTSPQQNPEPVGDPGPVGIVCDRFELRWELDGDDLLLAVDTDLPDEGELMVSVNRSYYQVGSGEEYSRAYLSVAGQVSRWREPNRIPLDADKWRANLAMHQQKIARYPNMAFEIASISDNVEIRAVLHLNQDDPRFGRWNSNVSGTATSFEGANGPVLVAAEESFEFPL